MKKLLCASVSTGLLGLAGSAYATEWFVNASAAPGGTGTSAAPFQTIAAAVAKAQTSDVITVAAGTYRESVRLIRSGTNTAPFTLRGAAGARVIVSGFQAIGGWQPVGGTPFYETNLGYLADGKTPRNANTLYVGMKRMSVAQYPNIGAQTHAWQSGADDGKGNLVLTDSALVSAGLGNLGGGYIEFQNSAGIFAYPIIHSDPATGTFTAVGAVAGLGSVPAPTTYLLKNAATLLDQPGDWAVVQAPDGTYNMYFYPTSAADLNATQAMVTGVNTIGTAGGLQYILIQNLEIIGGGSSGVAVGKSDYVDVESCVVHDNGDNSNVSAFGFSATTGCTIRRCRVTRNGNGLYFSNTHNATVTECDFGYNFNDAFDDYGNGSGNVFTKNYIHHNLDLYVHPDGLQTATGTSNVTFSQNVDMLGGLQGVELNYAAGITFNNNVIWNPAGIAINGLGSTTTTNLTLHNHDTTLGLTGLWGKNSPATFTNNIQLATIFLNPPSQLTAANVETSDHNFAYNPTTPAAPYCLYPTNYPTAAAFSAASGNVYDVHSIGSATTRPQFANMPDFDAGSQVGKNATVCTPNTLFLTGTNTDIPWSAIGSHYAVGDHIEFNYDGVVRTVSAVNTSASTITFSPPLSGYAPYFRAPGVENWHANTNYQRDTTLQGPAQALTLSDSGGPVGSTLSIPNYVAGTFDEGTVVVPPLPADVDGKPDFWINPIVSPIFRNTYTAVFPADSVAFYQLEASGYDSAAGHANPGVAAGGLAYSTVSQQGNYSGQFNGSGARLTVPNSAALQITGNLSLAAWVKPNSESANPNIISKSFNSGYRLRINSSGTLQLILGTSSTGGSPVGAISTKTVPVGQWSHVAATLQFNTGGTATVLFYVNGVADTAKTITLTSIYPGTGTLTVGTRSDDGLEAFNGLIDAAIIYNRVLSATEISAMAE